MLGKSLTLGQLSDLGSVEAARKYVTDRTVKTLMRGGVGESSKFFEGFEVSRREVAADWWEFREIDARRNLVAHADSKVNEIYLTLARDAGQAGPGLPKVGDKLDVSTQYLLHSLQVLAAFGALLGISTLLKRRSRRVDACYRWGHGLCEKLFESGLVENSSAVSGKLIAISHGRLERTLELDLRHIDWLARKTASGIDSIRGEVESFDYSGIDLLHSHMRHVILNDHDTARTAIISLVGAGAITKAAIRLRPQYAGLLESLGDNWLQDSPPID